MQWTHNKFSGDTNKADLFTGITRGVNRRPWFVESHAVPK